MNDMTYNKLYHAILTFCCCLFTASFSYAQMNLVIRYTDMFCIALFFCVIFIILNIINHEIFYISVPAGCAAVAIHFSGVKNILPYCRRFFNWLISFGNTDDEYAFGFSIIFAVIICAAACFTARLLVYSYRLQLILALALFVAYIAMLLSNIYFFKRSIIFAFLYFLIVLTEYVHMHRTDNTFKSAKQKVVNLFPSILLIFLMLLAIPIKKEPINLNIVGTIRNFINQLDFLPGNGPTTYDMSFTGYSDNGMLKDSIIQRNKTVMTINVEDSTLTNIYLIGNVFDTFNGKEWTITTNEPSDYDLDYFETVYALARFNPGNYSDIIQSSSLDITFNNFISSSVFYPLKTKHLNLLNYTVFSTNGNLRFAQPNGDSTNYQLTYYQINLDNPYTYEFINSEAGYQYTANSNLSKDMYIALNERFANGSYNLLNLETELYNHSQYVHETYSQLPPLSKPITEYIEAITSGYDNDIDKLKAIEYTLNQYTYTTKPSITPSDDDFMEKFLLDSKEGYCTYYATAFTLMARYLGYPARYVQGFCIPAISDDSIKVSSKNAHAWSEVYFDGIGWIPFEPTPSYPGTRYTPWNVSGNSGDNLSGSQKPEEETQPQANSGDHYNINADDISPLPSHNTSWSARYKIQIAIASLLIILIMLPAITYIVLHFILKSARRKYAAMDNRQKVIYSMEKILLILSKFSFSMKDNETLSEFLNRITPEYMTHAPFLIEAIPRFEEIRYGNTEVSKKDAEIYNQWKEQLLESFKPEIKKISYWILYFKANK